MKNDIYSRSKILAGKLEKQSVNSANIAKDITDAIDYSATSGEALMKIKFHINKVLSDAEKYNGEIVKLAFDIKNDIIKLIG
ncbi:hypothetical protein [Pantoea allii]|uniref:hypothetical protein n=1 Tax=Pantoea allii TaxID=574096 RepID=UPI000A249C6D|nr:hypothetical protein [Pantoea allii]MBW1254544.1 hypothetical protein [Pantoea allii]MBW1263479.1 hypothetical protein [Pantoea allii]MBW1285740.1 hypothetical protein [Pantoea allii]ORM86898.1 hypothetical protein HA38_06550 [Pantoea allii]PBK02285.1 hypothetical protein CMR03_00015 [Pantoea allii]